jgi:hypothetical protein
VNELPGGPHRYSFRSIVVRVAIAMFPRVWPGLDARLFCE